MEYDERSVMVVERLVKLNKVLPYALSRALDELGLNEYLEIGSITLRVKQIPLQCPTGQVLVWETTAKPDGTIVSEWVCRQDK